jgi:6,7-dimethyl-8-ribityllumazine synthase
MPLPPGNLDGNGIRIAIAVARFNEHITSRLLDGALATAKSLGAPEPEVHGVPGSFELPVVALKLAKSGRFDAIICLGAVVRHETDHYMYVAGEAAGGISRVALDTGIPCIFGVLTTDTDEQALARSGEERNAGEDAVRAAVATVNELRAIGK